jgi:hypothetical protein
MLRVWAGLAADTASGCSDFNASRKQPDRDSVDNPTSVSIAARERDRVRPPEERTAFSM